MAGLDYVTAFLCPHPPHRFLRTHDLERREWLDQDGWRIVIVISEGIYETPLRTLLRVRAALDERGARFPKAFRQEWMRHFMVRG